MVLNNYPVGYWYLSEGGKGAAGNCIRGKGKGKGERARKIKTLEKVHHRGIAELVIGSTCTSWCTRAQTSLSKVDLHSWIASKENTGRGAIPVSKQKFPRKPCCGQKGMGRSAQMSSCLKPLLSYRKGLGNLLSYSIYTRYIILKPQEA